MKDYDAIIFRFTTPFDWGMRLAAISKNIRMHIQLKDPIQPYIKIDSLKKPH